MVWVHVTLSPYHQTKRLPARPCLQHENSNAVLAAKDQQHNHFKWAEFLAPIMALTPQHCAIPNLLKPCNSKGHRGPRL
jgi:hypothetical protein